jgi:hypothetical protein
MHINELYRALEPKLDYISIIENTEERYNIDIMTHGYIEMQIQIDKRRNDIGRQLKNVIKMVDHLVEQEEKK